MIRFVLQESNFVGSADERLEFGRIVLMVQVRDKGLDYSSGNERNGQILKIFLRLSGQDLVNEQILRGDKRVKSDYGF